MTSAADGAADRGRLPKPELELTGRQPKAVVHALDVLEAVARHGPGVTASEVSAALGLSRATTYRLLNVLVAEEYLVRLPDLSGFALGRRAIEFAGVASPAAWPPVSRRARGVIARIRGAVRWGVHLVLCSETGLVHVADEDPDHPAHLTHADDRVGSSTLARLGEEHRRGRAATLLFGPDDPTPGEACLVLAVLGEDGHLLAALVVTGPNEPLARDESDLRALLEPAAEELGELLG
jgi:DNA-binding IclR family transcriptional regulator